MGKLIFSVFLLLLIKYSSGQPLPVEVMTGNLYSTVNTITSKKMGSESKFGYFHLHTLQIDNKSAAANGLILQDLLYYEPIQHFRITGGSFYELHSGFAPSLGVQYIQSFKDLFVLVSPKVNLYQDLQYDLFSIVQYKPAITDRIKLYTRLQLLNVFGSQGNIKSYQWFRVGVEVKGIQFGLAMDYDQLGPDPVMQANWGGFIRKEIF